MLCVFRGTVVGEHFDSAKLAGNQEGRRRRGSLSKAEVQEWRAIRVRLVLSSQVSEEEKTVWSESSVRAS